MHAFSDFDNKITNKEARKVTWDIYFCFFSPMLWHCNEYHSISVLEFIINVHQTACERSTDFQHITTYSCLHITVEFGLICSAFCGLQGRKIKQEITLDHPFGFYWTGV